MSTGALAVLAGLPGVSPTRLRILLSHHEAGDIITRLARGVPLHSMCLRGVPDPTVAAWREFARTSSVDDARSACERLGLRVLAGGDDAYPDLLAVDPEPPAVLFIRGDLAALDARRVGIIGTRNATAAGRATASELGCALADAGVTIVSGLARGIDSAAHRGVRSSGGDGRAAAVVGNGLDRAYPKQNADLWAWVGEVGVVMSEWPPGVGPDAWRFPQRNRIIAALCEVLVVVESRERGGSLLTVRAAADRSVEVMAVPGSPRSRASAGTNQLLVDGVAPVTSPDDVLDMLGLDHRRQGELPFDPRPIPDEVQGHVLAVCSEQASTLDMIIRELGLGVGEAAMAAARLERAGWLVEAGGWFEATGSRLWRG